jgi:hypothetical protein
MKTLASILLAVVISLPAMALTGHNDYVITRDGQVIVSDLSYGLFNIRVKDDDGLQTKISYADVVSYKKGERIFEKKELFTNNKSTGSKVFMELIRQDNGLRLYRYSGEGAPRCERRSFFLEPATACKMYVYKGDQFLLELDATNRATVLDFFSK